jgi:hypothetical protein
MLIDVYLDYVMVCGQRVDRPSYISRLAWENHWLAIKQNHDS